MLHKAKEIYKQRCAEMEKLKRDNASSKDLEKAESKFRKAQAQWSQNLKFHSEMTAICIIHLLLPYYEGKKLLELGNAYFRVRKNF